MQVPGFFPATRIPQTPDWTTKAIQPANQQYGGMRAIEKNSNNSFEQLLGQIERQLDQKLNRFASL
ncbi:MAG: hypothetical protein H7829_00140 [Magnetococcus sp. THC-1_WYH]